MKNCKFHLGPQEKHRTFYQHQEEVEPDRVIIQSLGNSLSSFFILPTFIGAIYFLLMPPFSLSFSFVCFGFTLTISGGHQRSHELLHSLKIVLCFAFLFSSHLGCKKHTNMRKQVEFGHGEPQTQMLAPMPRLSFFPPFFPQDRRKDGSSALIKA